MPLTYTTNLNLIKPSRGYIDWDDELNDNLDILDTSITTNSTDISDHTSNVSNPHSTTAAQVGAIATGLKGTASGVAELDANVWVPAVQLGNLLWKAPVRVVSTTNVTVASPGATIDAVSMSSADRVLLTGQTTGSQNGVYVYNGSASAMTRATDADISAELLGSYYTAKEGTGTSKIWYNTNTSSITVGSTTLSYASISNTNAASGDLTGSYPNPTIAANAVTNAKLAVRAATSRIVGSTSSSTAVADLTGTQVTAMLDNFIGISGTATKGLVPAPGAITSSYFLAADGSWSVPSGTAGLTSASIPSIEAGVFASRPASPSSLNRIYYGTDTFTLYRDSGSAWQTIAPALSGVVTTAAGSLVTSLSDSVVTNSKFASMANNTVKGNVSGGSSAPSDLSVTQVKTLIGPFSSSTTGLVPASSGVGETSKFLKGDGSWGVPTVGAATSVANAVTFNNGGAGASSGTTFDGSTAVTISYNTLGAVKTDGTGASGTWSLSISGNAATATLTTNISGGTAGDLLYQSSTNTTGKVSLGTQYKVLQAGSSAPTWSPYTLPSVNGTANYALVTDGAGGTSWSQVSVTQGISGLGTNVATFLATPTSANLAAAITNETGSGALVFANTPTLVTPILGIATATSINKVAITAPATSATLSLFEGSTLATSGAYSTTLTATGTTTVTLPTSGTIYGTASSSITSLQLKTSLSDETGSGSAVFSTGATLSSTTIETGLTVNGPAAFNKQVYSPFVALTDGATISVDASVGNMFRVTLGGNRTVGAPTNSQDGQTINFHISQDGTGNRTLAWNSAYKWPSGVAPTLSTAANALDVVSCTYNSTLSYWVCTATRNFS